jgi:hypothetical protein
MNKRIDNQQERLMISTRIMDKEIQTLNVEKLEKYVMSIQTNLLRK